MSELDPTSEALLVFTEFGTPVTKRVDFDAVIGGSISHEARELLRVATQHRETLLDALDNSGHKVDPRNVVGGVENYLPYVYKITHSMEQSATAQIKLNKPLEFSWTSTLVKKARQKKEHKCGVLVYEVCFILTIQALAHYNTAKFLLAPNQTSRVSNLVAAAKELRKGAGILEFVAQFLLPRWVSPPDSRPPEVVIPVASALSGLFLCMAQRISVVQALQKKSPPSVVAKLLLGLAERYNVINDSLRRLNAPTYESLFEPVVDEPPMMAAVCYSLGLRYLGLAARTKEEPGTAVAFLRFASENVMKVTYTPAMAELYAAKVDAARRSIDEVYYEYKADNESVYFEGVPTRDRLEIPAGSFIVKPEDYSLPDVDAVSFASQQVEGEAQAARATSPPPEKRKSLSSWFGLGGSGKPAAGPAAGAAGGKLAAPPGYDAEVFDNLPEDIQREVVEQYRAENK